MPNHPNSWGAIEFWATIGDTGKQTKLVAVDETGRLWVNGDASPRPASLTEVTENKVLVYTTENGGIGLSVPPQRYASLPNESALSMRTSQYGWMPVNTVGPIPDRVKEALAPTQSANVERGTRRSTTSTYIPPVTPEPGAEDALGL